MQTGFETIWIIGASSGIGEALARLFDQRGCRVIASARRQDALEDLAIKGNNIKSLLLDVADQSSFDAAFDMLQDENCLPDAIIYCAGSYQPGGVDVLESNAARKHLEINYIGFIALLERAFPHFKARGHGRIAVVSSLTGYCGLPNAALYGPGKAALISLCETLRPDFDQAGIGLQVINPGFVKTPMTDKNDFSMPFLISADQAARHIVHAMEKDKTSLRFEIAFPLPMVWLLGFVRRLPYWLYFRLMRTLLR